VRANAVELTADSAWFLADALGAGSLPWVLAITPPYSEPSSRPLFEAAQAEKLGRIGVMTADRTVDPAVAQWIRLVCRATQWLELRFVAGAGRMLRGIVARGGGRTVVALRTAELVTFTEMDIDHPHALVPVLTAGLTQHPPARFDEFALPARVGARADEQIRNGAPLSEVLAYLGIPASARPVVEAAFGASRTYVEIVAGQHRDGHRISTDVGVSIVDTQEGRVLVAPSRAFDGEWVSSFTPATPLAIAAAVERLNAALPDGPWFPDLSLTRDFDMKPEPQKVEKCPTTL
jgi:ESX secretion-associated protein EspG